MSIKGTPNGTVTDGSGDFKLNIPNEKAIIVFSFVGYEQQEVSIGNQTIINISLKIDTKALDEVVVVGYGTQKKSDVTGAIGSVKGETLLKVPASSVGYVAIG